MSELRYRPNRQLDERGRAAADAARQMGFKSRLAQEVAYAAACFPGPNNLTYDRTAELICVQFGTEHHRESVGRMTRQMHRAGILLNKRLMPGDRYPGFKGTTEHGATSTVFRFKACGTNDPISAHERRRMLHAARDTERRRRSAQKRPFNCPGGDPEPCAAANTSTTPTQSTVRSKPRTQESPSFQEARQKLAETNPGILKDLDEIQRILDQQNAKRVEREAQEDFETYARLKGGRDPPVVD